VSYEFTDQVQWIGHIVDGKGECARHVLPGRKDLAEAPADWPETLFLGSLNIMVELAAPKEKAQTTFDIRSLVPEFSIPSEQIRKNPVDPGLDAPQGRAQVWRALLLAGGYEIACWAIHRPGLDFLRPLELVSHEGIRATYRLPRGKRHRATVQMFARKSSRP
jgi:hypothetical protein